MQPRPDVSVVTTGHDVADARLHREVAALSRAGLVVEVLGLGHPADAPPWADRVRTWRRGGPVRRALRALALPWRARGRVLLALDPDSTAGAWLRCRVWPPRRSLVADVHEDYDALLRDRVWARGLRGRAGRAAARVGAAAARRADVVVVADVHLLADTPNRLVLRNTPDASMLPRPAAPDPRPRALYVGDLRASRGLFTMLDALAVAPEWSLDLVGPVAVEDEAELARRLAEPALDERVRWHGRLPPSQAWALAEGAWAGLVLLEDTPAFRTAQPSKLYEYLACGLAVVTTDLPRPAELVTRTGAGRVVREADDVAGVLAEWLADPDALRACRERALQAATELYDGSEMTRFVDVVAALVRRG